MNTRHTHPEVAEIRDKAEEVRAMVVELSDLLAAQGFTDHEIGRIIRSVVETAPVGPRTKQLARGALAAHLKGKPS